MRKDIQLIPASRYWVVHKSPIKIFNSQASYLHRNRPEPGTSLETDLSQVIFMGAGLSQRPLTSDLCGGKPEPVNSSGAGINKQPL